VARSLTSAFVSLNRDNDQTVEVRAKNVDKQRVALHSIFYRILTSTGGNFVDFGNVAINSITVRAITIENLWSSPLSLELSSSHSEDVRLYRRSGGVESAATDVSPIRDQIGQPQLGQTIAKRHAGTNRKERAIDAFFPALNVASRQRTETPWQQPRRSGATAEKESLVGDMISGVRPRQTIPWGKSVAFKDRAILSNSEYLDLASGPPIDYRRVSPRSKRIALLDNIGAAERKDNPVKRLTFESDVKAQTTSEATEGISSPATTPPFLSSNATNGRLALTRRNSASPALTGRRRIRVVSDKAVDELSLSETLSALEQHTGHPSSFATSEEEDSYVRRLVKLRRSLEDAIQSNELVPADIITIPPRAEQTVYVVYQPNPSTRPHIQSTYRKQDSRLFLRLAEVDKKALIGTPFEHIINQVDDVPVRELMLRSNVCRSMLELGQAHINFSQLERGEQRTKRIVLKNRSERPLLYRIRKSGSIASGDIKLGSGRHGLIAAFSQKEVEFIFAPSMSGRFDQTVWVENVEDPDSDQPLYIKAMVKKLAPFTVDVSSLDFGDLEARQDSPTLSIRVGNVSKQTRLFVIDLDPSAFCFRSCVVDVAFVAVGRGRPSLGKEEEEEVEHLVRLSFIFEHFVPKEVTDALL
jgi:hypothetical protein